MGLGQGLNSEGDNDIYAGENYWYEENMRGQLAQCWC